MNYTHTTYAQARQMLADRLWDTHKIFWVDQELGIYLTEALRTFGLVSAFWRNRAGLLTIPGTAFYDVTTQVFGSPNLASLLTYTVTDWDIVLALQYHLLESTVAQNVWHGTEMFMLTDLQTAVQNRRNQFLSDTGAVVKRSIEPVLSPPIGRQPLDDTVIDVRRAAWLGAAPFDYYQTLWRNDERFLTAADQGWSVNPNIPNGYSILGPPPLELQLAPIPIVNGQVELLTVNTGPRLGAPITATLLGIPDDLSPAVKWGALADLLGMDGVPRDPVRAQYCETRYQQYVQLARLLPVVIHTELNGVPLIPCTLQELDSSTPEWQNIQSSPQDIATISTNLIALNPVPDAVYSATFDVVQKAVIPQNDTDDIQVGREQLTMILDYAEHLALFKIEGYEWHAATRQANNFVQQSAVYNQRLSAAALAALSIGEQSQKLKQEIPRRNDKGVSVGALRGTPSSGGGPGA